jgi:hypothetical protein
VLDLSNQLIAMMKDTIATYPIPGETAAETGEPA